MSRSSSMCFLVAVGLMLSGASGQMASGPNGQRGDVAASPDRNAPRIVNVVNFIRGVEPRMEMDLLEPVVQQIRLAREHGLPTTFLLQYDALIQPRFVDLLKRELTDRDEIGAWLEVVQPQVEAAGLTWRGRFPWDWHTDVGFTVGYTPAEREKLMDVYMSKFRETFGRWPRSVGCWLLDAPTLNYLASKYGIVAACVCKDQIGTDGYTLWGGYWNQAYYPSKLNAFMPAQTRENQVNVPVFRMLGSDPIYQYDSGFGGAAQGVVSLEPVYTGGGGGGSPPWVRWFFDVNFASPFLGFAYAQMGQENSFGWPAMSKGLIDQYKLLAEWSRAGRVRAETLAESGAWFRRTYTETPATAVVALKDWKNEGRRSVWYESRFYRVNFVWDGGGWRIRDIHAFNEKYAERYLTQRVTTSAATYDTLPVVDGFSWSSRETWAGMRAVSVGTDGKHAILATGEPAISKPDPQTLLITMPIQSGGELRIACEPAVLRVSRSGAGSETPWGLELTWSRDKQVPIQRIDPKGIACEHNGFAYTTTCLDGSISGKVADAGLLIQAAGGKIALSLDTLAGGK